MPIRDYPFTIIRPGDLARPFLPVRIANPDSNKSIRVYALIDTGADECALPATFASILGHNLFAGQQRKISTGNGVTIAYGHTTRIIIEKFSTQDVLIDFMPNLNVPLLGVRSFLSNFVLHIDYTQKVFSLKLPDKKKLKLKS